MPLPTLSPETRSRLAPFVWWVFWFYLAYAAIVTGLGLWAQVFAHWPISVAMAAGSYVAGATPMGGGTVGFPVLVLFFDQPASLGRNFSFMVQSVGMSSATVFLLCRRIPIAWGLLAWTVGSTAISLPLFLLFVTPHIPDLAVKLLFSVVWASFAVMTLVKLREIVTSERKPSLPAKYDAIFGVLVGIVGGFSASVTGVGIDMVLYAVLVLFYRVEVRCAVATSVVIMAVTSLMGAVISAALGRIDANALHNWLAAAPVVLLGAPLGSLMLYVIARAKTLVFVSALCVLQFVWTIVDERVTGLPLALAFGGVLALNLVFHVMHSAGGRLLKRTDSRALAGGAAPAAVAPPLASVGADA